MHVSSSSLLIRTFPHNQLKCIHTCIYVKQHGHTFNFENLLTSFVVFLISSAIHTEQVLMSKKTSSSDSLQYNKVDLAFDYSHFFVLIPVDFPFICEVSLSLLWCCSTINMPG